jgi:hypothetical protein
MPHDMMMQLLQRGHLQLHHDPQTGHIHVTLPQQ